jgi:hypothetical protein
MSGQKLSAAQFAKRYASLDQVAAIRQWRGIQEDPAYSHIERCVLWTALLHYARKGGHTVPFHPEGYLALRANEAQPLDQL